MSVRECVSDVECTDMTYLCGWVMNLYVNTSLFRAGWAKCNCNCPSSRSLFFDKKSEGDCVVTCHGCVSWYQWCICLSVHLNIVAVRGVIESTPPT